MKSAVRESVLGALSGVVGVMLRRKLHRDVWFEHAMCLALRPRRLSLPVVELADLVGTVPPVSIDKMPRGSWSSPVADLVAMARIVAATRPAHAMEIGSFRGYTAAAMAAHLPPGGRLVTVDIAPEHGEAYRDTPLAERIERKIGTAQTQLDGFADKSFDLVFVDADHRYEAARLDTETVRRLVAERGWLLWHDYANWGYFTKANGVPEYLVELSATVPLAHIAGTNIAVHTPYWLQPEGRARFDELTGQRRSNADPWASTVSRP